MAELLTAQELSETVFGGNKYMSHDKLYRLAKKGRIPAIKLDGRWFFPLAEVREWYKAESQVKTAATATVTYGRLRVVGE